MARPLSLPIVHKMSLPIAATLAVLQAPTTQITSMIFMYGAIFAIFYFILIRPQQAQRKKRDAQVAAVKKGDEVVTAGGIIGEVVHIAQQSKDGESVPAMTDRITIKSGESRLIVERGRIDRVLTATSTSA